MMIATLVNTSSCGCGNGSRQVEPSFVQGPADDTCGQVEAGQPADILQGADSSGGDDRQAHLPGQLCSRFEVRSFQHAVAADVGVNEGGQWPGLILPSQIERSAAGYLEPAIGGHLSLFGI